MQSTRELFRDTPLVDHMTALYLDRSFIDQFCNSIARILFYYKDQDLSYYPIGRDKNHSREAVRISQEILFGYESFKQSYESTFNAIPTELEAYNKDLTDYIEFFSLQKKMHYFTESHNLPWLVPFLAFAEKFKNTDEIQQSDIAKLFEIAVSLAQTLNEKIVKPKAVPKDRFQITDLLNEPQNAPILKWQKEVIDCLFEHAKKHESDTYDEKLKKFKSLYGEESKLDSPDLFYEICHENTSIGEDLMRKVGNCKRLISYGAPIRLVSWFSFLAQDTISDDFDLEKVFEEIFIKSKDRQGAEYFSEFDRANCAHRQKSTTSRKNWSVLNQHEIDTLKENFDSAEANHPDLFKDVLISKLAVDALAPIEMPMPGVGFTREFPKKDTPGRESRKYKLLALDDLIRPYFKHRQLCILELIYPEQKATKDASSHISDKKNEMFGEFFTRDIGEPDPNGSPNVHDVKALLLNPILNGGTSQTNPNQNLFYFLWLYQKKNTTAKEIYKAMLGARQKLLFNQTPARLGAI